MSPASAAMKEAIKIVERLNKCLAAAILSPPPLILVDEGLIDRIKLIRVRMMLCVQLN
jgi:hypothetical protein